MVIIVVYSLIRTDIHMTAMSAVCNVRGHVIHMCILALAGPVQIPIMHAVYVAWL